MLIFHKALYLFYFDCEIMHFWNQPVLSNEGKLSMGLKLTTDLLPV